MKKLALPILGAALLLASCGGSETPTTDTTAPTVKLSGMSPTTPGDFTLTASTSDNVGVTKVEFYQGSTLISTDTDAPYTATFTVDQRNNGSVSFTAKAYDAAGNVGQGGLNTTININTLYQGDWVWVAVDSSNNVVASGLTTLFSQTDVDTGTLALGVYGKNVAPGDFKSDVGLEGLTVMGPVTDSGQLQVRLVRDPENKDLFILADDDDNALETQQGRPFFFDDDAELRADPTSSRAVAFGMSQVSTTPSLEGLSVSAGGFSAQSRPQLQVAKLIRQASALAASAKTPNGASTSFTAGQLFPLVQKVAAAR
ncbi:Ig-like domain-containing protein [Deinococcus apachensis]|uniref:Ig-like domain-containing protein n=1 Tax=Deinococcus apachensis TaxID=309886 RepID=UPI00035FC116|nr:Ig-like domain-containing protein [Deinococcus apachensis]